ncbi:MAG: EF-hand domain-containing protein [Zetaproteobacteria bacterium]|nr:EF-hand domain-containing protein [Zetaproteobacteria bacterium]
MQSNTVVKILGIPFVGLILMSSAYAGESWRDQMIDKKYKVADTNHDDQLTLAEAQAEATGMPRVASNFRKIDVENKGYVTLEQIKAMADQ